MMQVPEADILADPGNHALIRRYFDDAVSSGRLNRAKLFFESLLNRYTAHHQARTLYVSTCLQLEAYPDAMAAIETLITFSDPDEALFDAALKVREKLGPMRVAPEGAAGSRISVCMIVKNEQRHLAACLNAVKKLADEIVMVDTGSEDRSVDIGRIFGARVSQFQWRDDFSAARNAGLERAEGDWILVLDADEIIAEQDHAELQKMLIEVPVSTAFSMETRNYTHHANTVKWHANGGRYASCEAGIGWFPSKKIRLFPNNPQIRFQFPVHELVAPSVRSAGCEVKDCPVPIHHYGHLNETKNRRKAMSYFKMGYAKLEQLGDDVAAIRELAVQAGQLELWPESLDLWQRLLAIRPDFGEAFVNMSGAYWQMARYQEAMAFAERAMRLDGRSRDARYNLAVSHLMLGCYHEAHAALGELVEASSDDLAARFMAAAASICAGDHRKGTAILFALRDSGLGTALVFGIQDLVKRMRAGGRENEAAELDRAARSVTSQGDR